MSTTVQQLYKILGELIANGHGDAIVCEFDNKEWDYHAIPKPRPVTCLSHYLEGFLLREPTEIVTLY